MSLFARVALGLALVLPIAAYVVGSLVAADPAPAQHSPIVLEESAGTSAGDPVLVDPDPEPGTDPGEGETTATPGPTATPSVPPTEPTKKPTKKPSPRPEPTKTADQPAVVRPPAIDPDDDDYDDLDDDDDTETDD